MSFPVTLRDARVRERIAKKTINLHTRLHPILYFLGCRSEASDMKFGKPNTGVFLGAKDADISPMMKKKAMQDAGYSVRYITREPNVTGLIQSKDAPQQASPDFVDDLYGRGIVRWTPFRWKIKVRQQAIDEIRSDVDAAAVMDDAVDITMNHAYRELEQQIATGTVSAARQLNSNDNYNGMLSIQHINTPDLHYAGIDRSVTTRLNPLVIDAAATLPSTAINNDLGRIVNVGNRALGITGLSTRMTMNPTGSGALKLVCFLNSDLWLALADQTEGNHIMYENGLPEFPVDGFKGGHILQHDQVYYVSDDVNVPAGTARFQNLTTKEFHCSDKYNFTTGKWTLAHEVSETSAEYQWTTLKLDARLIDHRTDLNCDVINLTAN